jgi:hypothetical protein
MPEEPLVEVEDALVVPLALLALLLEVLVALLLAALAALLLAVLVALLVEPLLDVLDAPDELGAPLAPPELLAALAAPPAPIDAELLTEAFAVEVLMAPGAPPMPSSDVPCAQEAHTNTPAPIADRRGLPMAAPHSKAASRTPAGGHATSG